MHNSLKKIPVIYYHSIGPIVKGWTRNYLTIEPFYFEKHLKYYRDNYTVIDLNEYYGIRNGKIASPKNPLVITIDDGYLDNWIWAFPLLKKYNLKATIFVSPEMIEPGNKVRKITDQNLCGYMSWEELRLMDESGLVDIQSHTMSHTKYFVSDKIIGFHHKNADCLYPVGNLFPEKKPFYIANKEFETLIPYGTPFFEERSSVIAKKVTVNKNFVEDCINILKNDEGYNFENFLNKTGEIYNKYKKENRIIIETETNGEFRERLVYEIAESKKIIEKELNKKVEFLSWPHGDNSIEAHDLAMKSGYKATTVGKLKIDDATDRIGPRFGYRPYFGSPAFGFFKLKTKIKDLEGKGSATLLKKIFQALRMKK
jgi:hypothetical protein